MLLAVVAATILNLPFGTIYAFSVFLTPMEALLSIGRTEMTVVFALATISLTAGMNLAPHLYRSLPPALLVLAAGAASAVGLAITAMAGGLTALIVGYGLLFGIGGGIGFIVLQHAVNQAAHGASGLVNGYVVSLYPLGAMLGAPLFGWAIGAYGLRATLAALAATVLLASIACALLLRVAAIRLHDPALPSGDDVGPARKAVFQRLFMVFFLAAAAGLTVLSQAAGIVQAYGGVTALALGATTLITGAIAVARVSGGALADRYALARVAGAAHLWSLAGALMLTVWPGALVSVLGLAMIGMGYGLVSGLTAAAIPRYWHRSLFGHIAGRLYIAWCVAAISLPVLAGVLFDQTQGYRAAVMIAAGVNLAGFLVALGLPAPPALERRGESAPVG